MTTTIAISVLLFIAAAAIITKLSRDRREGKCSGCSCGCCGCCGSATHNTSKEDK
ncbi:FeoB-associated Cys-rich membrane protein [Synergistes jonesii]|uniref:FeoB-associated Cys-rich membrane protein n=1 Tax=Synergistes jonesii TaxID=2754 RepID=UPI00248E36EB|nr:FeoB-associated Cys-rich membrane protein [Synergistes jonesii]